MPNPYGSAYAVAQTTLGLGKEATRGTAATNFLWVPVREPKYKPDRTFLADNTLQGSMVTTYSLTPGMRYDSHGWDSYIYLDTFPLLVQAELGSPDTVGTAPSGLALASPVSPGATSISLTATTAPVAGQWVAIGYPGTSSANYAGTIETHKIKSVSGTASPYTCTLYTSINYAHSTTEPVTGLTSHTFSLLNNIGAGDQPPSYTIMDYDGEEWRQLTAAQIDELTITGNATELLSYTCTWFANPSVTPATPSPSFSGVRPVPSYTTAFLMNGVQAFDVEEFELDFKRGTKPIPAFTGTEEYFEYFAGPLDTTGNKLTVIETAGAPELTAFQNGLNQPFDFFMYDIWTGNAMHVHCTNTMYVTGELTRSKEYVEATLTFDFLPSAADATAGGVSPVLIEIANAQTTSY